MNLIILLFPISIIIIALFYIVCYVCLWNLFGITLCVLSLLKWISIKPFIMKINDMIYEYGKDYFDGISRNIRDTFLVKGNRTNTKQAIYLFHPHGICSLTHAFHINTDSTDWPNHNMYSIVSHLFDKIPFALDLFNDRDHIILSDYDSMKKGLESGKSISLFLGNYTEGKYDNDHRITAIVKNRKGIFKMALETGIPIIPVLSYGEQSIFKQHHLFGLTEMIYAHTGIQLNCPDWSSIMEWMKLYQKPLDKKIVTYIGDAIEIKKVPAPIPAEITALRDTYMESLRTLYRTTRPDDYEEEIVLV